MKTLVGFVLAAIAWWVVVAFLGVMCALISKFFMWGFNLV